MPIDLHPGLTVAELKTTAWLCDEKERAFWRLADVNGPAFVFGQDGTGNDVVPAHALETDDRTKIRKRRAKAPSLVRHIVDHYVAHVFRAQVKREGTDAAADDIIADADGHGMPIDRFMRVRTRKALLEAESYVLVDTNVPAAPQTQADAQASDARFILRPVDACQVIASVCSEGSVVEAVVVLIDQQGAPFLWHVNGTHARKATLNKDGDAVVSVDEWKAHPYGGCPLVRVGNMPAFVPAVAESQKRLAVLDSLLMCELHAAAFSQPVFTGVDPKIIGEILRSNSYVLAFPNPNAKASMLGSDPAQAESIRNERDAELQNAYREAKVSPVQATPGAPESGVARAYRFVDADVELAGIAEAVETAERTVWARLAAAGACAEPTVTYARTFIPVDDAAELDKLLAVWGSNLPDTIRRAAVMRYAEAVGLSDDDVADLEAELDTLLDQGADEPPADPAAVVPFGAPVKAGAETAGT